MLENITKIITRFFGIIAGSLSGISAILIAIGFLAERSYLNMLGFTEIPVDLNEYLYTGARLMGFLPGIVIVQTFYLITEPLFLAIVLITVFIRISMRYENMARLWQNMFLKGREILARFKVTFLILFVFVQFYSIFWLIKAVSIENLLFTEYSVRNGTSLTIFNADTENLKSLILSSAEQDKDALARYFTVLFLTILVIGLTIRYLTILGKEKQAEIPFHMKFWLGINYLLFATQVFLLPGNFGVLLLNNKYQEVKVQFMVKEATDSVQVIQPAVSENLTPKAIHKIRNQALLAGGSPFNFNLEASPGIFTDPNGDILHYSAISDEPEIAKAAVQEHFLTVVPQKTGKALITVEAKDNDGMSASTNFKIEVIDKNIPWGVKEENPIPPKTMIAGGENFTRDLMAGKPVFSFLDKEPVDLTFQASSGSSKVADVSIDNKIITVRPRSKGIAAITITANDGYGRQVSSEFNVTVVNQNLDWPVDERLLLLYESDEVFYFYSKLEKRVWYVPSGDVESMVYYGLAEIF